MEVEGVSDYLSEGLIPEGERVDIAPTVLPEPPKMEDKTQIKMAIASLLYK